MNDDDLIRELQSLPREHTPPPGVRDEVMRSVRRQRTTSRATVLWRTAAAALVVIGAFVLGRLTAPTAGATPPQQFALLLYGETENSGERNRVLEYSAWARSLRNEGRWVDGERLGSQTWTIGESHA